jgi:hypothetical protein
MTSPTQIEIATGDPRRLDLQSIIDEAMSATGLSDMGAPDILPDLQVLLTALVNEARLSVNGVEAQRAALTNLVLGRYELEYWSGQMRRYMEQRHVLEKQ